MKRFAGIEYGFTVEPKGETPPLFRQVHGKAIVAVPDDEARLAALAAPADADGAYSLCGEAELYVFTADCIPLLFFSPEPGGPTAAVHCGWRGALSGIARAAKEILTPAAPELHVAVGPSILSCCFEVKEDFIRTFQEQNRPIERYLEKRGGRLFCDLYRFVRCEELGEMPDDRLHTDELRCTYCSSPRLPSYRRNGGTDPRLRSWVRRFPR